MGQAELKVSVAGRVAADRQNCFPEEVQVEIVLRQVAVVGHPFRAAPLGPYRKRVTAGPLSFATVGLARAPRLPLQTPASVLTAA